MDLKNSCHTFCSVTKSCPTLCDAVDCSMPGSPSSVTGVCLNSCPLSQWCYLTISFSATPFSFCLQSFPVSGSFPVSWLSTSGGHRIRASATASVLPMNIQGWVPLGLTALISLPSKGLSRVFTSTTVWKHQFFGTQPYLRSNSHIHTWLLEKPWLWLYRPLFAKWCLCFLILYVCHSFSAKEQASSNFMAAVTICSDFVSESVSRSAMSDSLPPHGL